MRVARGPVVALVVCLAVVTAAGFASGAGITRNGYSLTIEGSVETPSVTRSLDGVNYTIDEIGVVDPGGVSVDARSPRSDAYRVYLYNHNQQIISQQRATRNRTVRFDLADAPAGSYVISLHDDGIHQVLSPLVVRGYDVDASVTGRAPAGTSVDVRVDATYLRGPGATAVTAIVANDSTIRERRLSRSANVTTEGEVATAGLAPGTYDVYVAVRGNQRAFGQRELLGFAKVGEVQLTDGNRDGDGTTGTARTTETDTETTAREDVLTPATPGTTSADGPNRGLAWLLFVVLTVGLGWRLVSRNRR